MEKINYGQLYTKLTKGLSVKTKNIFDRRFGVKSGKPETLESIGDSLGITRERVRQIEEAGFNFIRKNNQEIIDKTHSNFDLYFQKKGGFKKEEIILSELGGGKKSAPYVLFLLTLGDQFSRVCEKKDYTYFWTSLSDGKNKIKESLATLVSDMDQTGKPFIKKDFYETFTTKYNWTNEILDSYLEISKNIQLAKDGRLGLISWPEIKPRGVKDKAYLAFRKFNKPLHFTDVAKMIDKLEYNLPNKKTYAQTVHNELIKDTRFVLVGRGTYALAEWGYVPGTIKDVIVKVLKDKNNQPAHKDEIVKNVLSQRLVAKNTVLMNLNNKKHFDNDGKGNYFLRNIQAA
jgi:DNA-directed RNA polymerase delta subunit